MRTEASEGQKTFEDGCCKIADDINKYLDRLPLPERLLGKAHLVDLFACIRTAYENGLWDGDSTKPEEPQSATEAAPGPPVGTPSAREFTMQWGLRNLPTCDHRLLDAEHGPPGLTWGQMQQLMDAYGASLRERLCP
jgi:hypothetical protein